MKETFVVKNAVGGPIFIDTSKRSVAYEFDALKDGGTKFIVRGLSKDQVAGILQSKNELNMFIFREYDEQPTVKTWYYVEEGSVHYDGGSGVLTITAMSSIVYVPDEYMRDVRP